MVSILGALVLVGIQSQSTSLNNVTWVSGSGHSIRPEFTTEQLDQIKLLPDGVSDLEVTKTIVVKTGQRLVFIEKESTGLALLDAVTGEVDEILKKMSSESSLYFTGTALQLPFDSNSILAQYVRLPVGGVNEVVGMSNVQVSPDLQVVVENNAGQSGTFSSPMARVPDPSTVVSLSPSKDNTLIIKSNSMVPTSITATALGRFRQTADITDSMQGALKAFWNVFEGKKLAYNLSMEKFVSELFAGAFPNSPLEKIKVGASITNLRNIGDEDIAFNGFGFSRVDPESEFKTATIKSVRKRVFLSATFLFKDGRTQPLMIELGSRLP